MHGRMDSMSSIVLPTNVIVGDPDLVPGNILGGKNILGVEGAITKRQGGEFPGYERATAVHGTSNRLHMFVPKGAYIDGTVFDGNLAGVFADDADYTAANIKSGVNIFGVAGTFVGPGWKSQLNPSLDISRTIVSVNEYNYAFSITGLDFTPKVILIFKKIGSGNRIKVVGSIFDFSSFTAWISNEDGYTPEVSRYYSENAQVSAVLKDIVVSAGSASGKIVYMCDSETGNQFDPAYGSNVEFFYMIGGI
jgi:hypothetical protein